MTLDVGATARLVLDAARQRLLIDGRDDQVFCQFSVPCAPLAEQPAAVAEDKLTIHSNASARIQKNWAQPQGECASCFQHVLVGLWPAVGVSRAGETGRTTAGGARAD